jgi:hypothetical protein
MEENSIVDEQSQQHLQRPPGPFIRQASIAIPPTEVFQQRQFHDESYNNVDDNNDDDDFVCNPSPNTRAPAVIMVPVPKGCDLASTNKRRTKRFNKRRRRRSNNDGSFPSLTTTTDSAVHEYNGWDFTLRLFSNVIFLVSSCLHLNVAIGILHEIDNGSETAFGVLSLLSSSGFFIVGCLEIFMAETFWTQLLFGSMMIVASVLGGTANTLSLLRPDDSAVSLILTSVSLHVYAMVAVSIFVLHEDFADETASTTTSRGDNSDERDRGQQQQSDTKMPHEPSPWWRRLADAAFMIGTILDSILSYFYIFDMASAASALPVASIGAAWCWVLAAILFLLVTIQSRQHCDRTDTNKRERKRCFCCCCFHSCCNSTTQFSDHDNVTTKNVTITVVEGNYTSSDLQDSDVDGGILSCYGRRIMQPNIDRMCSGESQLSPSCIYSSIGDRMNAAELRSSANIIMKQVDTVFDQHFFCG